MNYFLDFINLAKGEENKNKVLENVKSNISFRGSNLWILVCAIVIASVGLNVNSTAVVIGAMLISPLMGPIVGAGFGLGTFDFILLKKSLKNLLIATVASLIVSTLYFFLSPFKDTQSELLSRTSPNIYDILIAFFGGLVGVIAITRVEKGNPIPGVAIATALMPPLCTAGYGLAIGNFKFFFGALYLYTINCLFIFLATFLIVKYLKYRRIEFLNKRYEKRLSYIMSFLIIIVIVPSIYFAYILLEEKKYNEKVNTYLENEFTNKGYIIFYKKTNYISNPHKIELALLTKKFNLSEVDSLSKKLKAYKIFNTQLTIRQDTTDLKKDILNEIALEKSTISKKDALISNLKKQLQDSQYDNKALLSEVKILFPEIETISIANHILTDSINSKAIVAVIYSSKKEVSSINKLAPWLEKRLSKGEVQIYRQQAITDSKVKSKSK